MVTAVPGDPTVSVRHSAVPGRVRLEVSYLHRYPERKLPLEQHLLGVDGVHTASANHLTGCVLVHFDPEVCSAHALVRAAREGAVPVVGIRGVHPHPNPLPEREGEIAPLRPSSANELVKGSPHSLPSIQHPAPSTQHLPWHAMSAGEVIRLMDADPQQGLAEEEIALRRQRVGPNRLPEPKEPSILKLLGEQFLNAPSALLGVGVVLSLATGALVDALLVGGVMAANALLGAATERSGQRAILALRRAVPIRARALRDGDVTGLDAGELVPGDTVQLLPGDPVPADARITEAHRLQVEESALTGEPHGVEKSVEAVPERAPLADRGSMVYRGTAVVGGRGRAVVVATGKRTAMGGLRMLAAEAKTPQTPLQRDLDRAGQGLAGASAAIALGVTGLSLLRGVGLVPALSTAVALGVAAFPEGLPALATTVLALGSARMRRKGTLVRSLGAAEALGSVTVVCADKTGTLTENRMAVGEFRVDGSRIGVGGPALSPKGGLHDQKGRVSAADQPVLWEVLRTGVLCSDAEVAGRTNGELSIDGSPTEGALLMAAIKAGLDVEGLRREYPRIDRRDRGDGRRHMVTVHRAPHGLIALAKGAPDEILELCERILVDDRNEPLDQARRFELQRQNADMTARAMRVLAFARKEIPEPFDEGDLKSGFSWCGLAGLVDPIRSAAPEAIRALHRAGIRTVMITGDQAGTAAAVARQLGLKGDGQLRVLEAEDLADPEQELLHGLVQDVDVFARTPPEMKLAIVRALQSSGQVVAMTGDGINDAPALRAADVGVAMGKRGTELARELADVVLSTDDISQMVVAVEEGRLVRANVRRVLHYLLSTNASEVWAVAISVALGLPSPLSPAQLLWLNLISDLTPALGLAMEPADPDLMAQPPQDPREPIVPASLQRRILAESAALAAGSLAAYGIGLLRHGPGPHARTMAFWSLATAQLLHVPLARAGHRSALRYGRPFSRSLLLGLGGSALLQLAVLLVPGLRAVLGGVQLAALDWAVSLLAAVTPIALVELQRNL